MATVKRNDDGDGSIAIEGGKTFTFGESPEIVVSLTGMPVWAAGDFLVLGRNEIAKVNGDSVEWCDGERLERIISAHLAGLAGQA